MENYEDLSMFWGTQSVSNHICDSRPVHQNLNLAQKSSRAQCSALGCKIHAQAGFIVAKE